MKEIRIGVIGCGQVAINSHVPLLSRMSRVKLVALADTNKGALEQCSRHAPNAVLFQDWHDLIESRSMDAVVIALPTHLHAAAAVAAFEAGLHVYLEKPIAAEIDDARRIVDAWRASNAVGMTGFNFRFNPLVQKLKYLVASGRIGHVASAQTRFVTPVPGITSWRATRNTGGGALLDLAVHHIDLIRFILDDEIESVAAKIESRRSDEDLADLTLRTRRGCVVNLEVAFGESFHDRLEFHGSDGILWMDRGRSLDVGVSKAARRTLVSRGRAVIPTPSRLRFLAESRRSPYRDTSFNIALKSFVNAAVSRQATHPDMTDGMAALRVIGAVRESASTGNTVTVGEAANGGATQRS